MKNGKNIKSNNLNKKIHKCQRAIVYSIIESLDPVFSKYISRELRGISECELSVCILLRLDYTDECICKYLDMTKEELNETYIKIINSAVKNIKSFLIKYIKSF